MAKQKQNKKSKKRGKIDARSSEILEQVLGESANAKQLYDKAIGYAIFDSTKAALGISGGGGSLPVTVFASSVLIGEEVLPVPALPGVGLGVLVLLLLASAARALRIDSHGTRRSGEA